MLAVASQPFSSTISGTITPVLITLLGLMLGYIVKSQLSWKNDVSSKIEAIRMATERSFTEQNSALAKQSEALAVILTKNETTKERLEELSDSLTLTNSNVSVLQRSTDVLTDRLNRIGKDDANGS